MQDAACFQKAGSGDVHVCNDNDNEQSFPFVPLKLIDNSEANLITIGQYAM